MYDIRDFLAEIVSSLGIPACSDVHIREEYFNRLNNGLNYHYKRMLQFVEKLTALFAQMSPTTFCKI